MESFLEKARVLQDEIVSWRRHIHENPEIEDNLPHTRAFVIEKLRSFGYEPKELPGGSVVALAGGKQSGKCIMIREDMDALPIREETELPFKSQNGYMHACGHDIHTALLLASAKILKDHETDIKGTIKLLFQASEENLCGAAAAIRDGVLDNPKVDAAITLHVDGMSPWKLGVLTMAQPGVVLSSCDVYRIEIKGMGGHGAYPDQAIDPVNVGAHIHIALQELLSREIAASDQAVLTQGVFHSGDAPNIIPDTAYMEGTLRTYDEGVRKKLLKRMEEVCEMQAKVFRAEAKLIIKGGCASFLNDAELFKDIESYLIKLVGEAQYVHEGSAGVCFASEDFSNISRLVPSVQLGLVVGSMPEGDCYPMHHPKICFHEDALYRGAAGITYAAFRWLEEHQS